jgi:hypothetical protein
MEPDMKDRRPTFRPAVHDSLLCIVSLCVCLGPSLAAAQKAPAPSDAQALYRTIQSFELTGSTARVDNLTLERHRAQMTFTGSFYFAAPANGRVTGAVFVGLGTFRADVPPSPFEQDNLRIGSKPRAMELDPDMWILSEKTTTRAVAGEHFVKTRVAQKFGIGDLDLVRNR